MEIPASNKKIVASKAQQSDNITFDLIEYASNILGKSLTILFNIVFKFRRLTAQWSGSKIIFIFKTRDHKDLLIYFSLNHRA